MNCSSLRVFPEVFKHLSRFVSWVFLFAFILFAVLRTVLSQDTSGLEFLV